VDRGPSIRELFINQLSSGNKNKKKEFFFHLRFFFSEKAEPTFAGLAWSSIDSMHIYEASSPGRWCLPEDTAFSMHPSSFVMAAKQSTIIFIVYII
jgi:hypothetical protein